MVKIERVFHRKVSILPSLYLQRPMIKKLRQRTPQATRCLRFKLAIGKTGDRTSNLRMMDSNSPRPSAENYQQARSCAGGSQLSVIEIPALSTASLAIVSIARDRTIKPVRTLNAKLVWLDSELTLQGETEFAARA